MELNGIKIHSAGGREIIETLKDGEMVFSLQHGKHSDCIMIHWFGKVRPTSPKKTHNMVLERSGDKNFVNKGWEIIKTRLEANQ